MQDNFENQQAMILFDRAYRHQMKGEFGQAILLYQRSITVQPTAEAHTFLGWTYSMMNRYEEAIDSCKKAIEVDPEYGNPYNDIGVYLIEQGKWQESITWLEQAINAPRYDSLEFPLLNLGRVYEHLGQFRTALSHYEQALEINPFYRPAINEKYGLLAKLS
jgi:tetratricopeptide (TPR) repeat protein